VKLQQISNLKYTFIGYILFAAQKPCFVLA